jgi:hypothetical protein
MVRQAVGGSVMPLRSEDTAASAPPHAGLRLETEVSLVAGMRSSSLECKTQPSQRTPGRAVIELGAAPATPELATALRNTISDFKSGIFDRYPKLVTNALNRIRPLAAKPQLTRHELLTLMDATNTLRSLPQEKRSRLSSTQHASIGRLALAVDMFVGPTSTLCVGLHQLSGNLEARLSVPSFTSYMKNKHPDMLEHDPATGSYSLSAEGQQKRSRFETEFERQWKRHVLPPAESLSGDENVIAKIVANEYPRYQTAMRLPDDRLGTKMTLIECAQIVDILANVTPQKITQYRYATVFPGGIADPLQLVKGQEYTEPGIVFVGGERGSDRGYRMKVSLIKGIPVDARALYGHPAHDDEKLQWLTLPGAKFRFDGHTGSVPEKHKTYMFTQIER